MFEKLDVKEWMQFNADLQKKKNAVRKTLKERGILKREGTNTFDKYKYFTEAQYKQLFTELLAENGLELNFNEVSYDTFDGTEKQENGRMVKIAFQLIDVETGFFEETVITGEGIDKGDKAGYKAYTGALKYYFADKFMVATGDDPEVESPEYKMNRKQTKMATKEAIQYIKDNTTAEQLQKLLEQKHVNKVEDLTDDVAMGICIKLNERKVKEA